MTKAIVDIEKYLIFWKLRNIVKVDDGCIKLTNETVYKIILEINDIKYTITYTKTNNGLAHIQSLTYYKVDKVLGIEVILLKDGEAKELMDTI